MLKIPTTIIIIIIFTLQMFPFANHTKLLDSDSNKEILLAESTFKVPLRNICKLFQTFKKNTKIFEIYVFIYHFLFWK